MNNIFAIISTLTPTEKKKFVQKLKQKNKRKDIKNIELFRLLDKEVPEENLEYLLYGKNRKGAYHALCKRLYDSLIDFIASKNIEEESSTEMHVLKLILVSRSFFRQQKITLGFKSLAKAKLIAGKYALYNSLHEIHQLELSHAHLSDSVKFHEVCQQMALNKQKLIEEENLNLFYAAVHEELEQKKPEHGDVIERNLKRYQISITNNLSYQSLFKILQISNEVANVTRKYHGILDFVEQAIKKIQVSGRARDEHLYFHIQILYYLANTYFRIKDFSRSTNHIEEMHRCMCLKEQKYYHVFSCQFELLNNLLLIYKGHLNEAVENLSRFDFKKYKSTEVYVHDLKLTLIMSLFLQEKFKEALKLYRDFFHSDKWYAKRIGSIWVIKKNLLEILLLIELDYIDLIESRLKSFRKKHRAHLIEHDEQRILNFVQLISTYYSNQSVIHDDSFNQKLDDVLQGNTTEEDIFAISFYTWLKAKILSQNTYETCLFYIERR